MFGGVRTIPPLQLPDPDPLPDPVPLPVPVLFARQLIVVPPLAQIQLHV